VIPHWSDGPSGLECGRGQAVLAVHATDLMGQDTRRHRTWEHMRSTSTLASGSFAISSMISSEYRPSRTGVAMVSELDVSYLTFLLAGSDIRPTAVGRESTS
jgi:hypothetical protein